MNAYAKVAVTLLVLAGAFGFGHHTGAIGVQAEWDAERVVIARAEKLAVAKREKENAEKEAKNAAVIVKINGVHDEEIASVRSALAVSLRRGTGICSGPAATAKVNPTGSSDASSATSGVFREDIDRDIRAAMMEMESVAATARACQAFVRSAQQ